MKKLLVTFLAAFFISGCGAGIRTVVRQDFNPAGRMAVMPFSGKAEDVGLSLSEAFTTYLMEAGFEMIERAQIENVLKEQKMSLSGGTDVETMVQIGKLAGVDVVVTGSYRTRREEIRTVTRPLPAAPRKPGKRYPPGPGNGLPGNVRVESNTIFSGLTVKFVDVNTGRVLMSSSAEKDYNADSVNRALAAMARSIRKTLDEQKGGK
jgi:curli biogenesis system outer membrane secretion channel CsgG